MKTINLLKNSLPENCKISKVKKWNGRYDFDFTKDNITIRASVSQFNYNTDYILSIICNCLMAINAEIKYQ